jgi:hypothetical protein
MRELVEEPRHEYPHFVAALSFIAALPPDEVVELLRHRASRLASRSPIIVVTSTMPLPTTCTALLGGTGCRSVSALVDAGGRGPEPC